jgi:hypothetical protein
LKNLLAATGSVEQGWNTARSLRIKWRSIARAAARRLGRPVQTLEFDGIFHASLQDWQTLKRKPIHLSAVPRAMDGLKF